MFFIFTIIFCSSFNINKCIETLNCQRDITENFRKVESYEEDVYNVINKNIFEDIETCNLKQEMEMYINDKDFNKIIEIDSIELDTQKALDKLENAILENNFVNQNKKLPFYNSSKLLTNCQKSMNEFKFRINRMKIIKYFINLDEESNEILKECYKKIYIFSQYIKLQTKKEFVKTFEKIENLCLKKETYNLITQVVSIFRDFMTIFDLRRKYGSNKIYSAYNKISTNNYNKEVMLLFNYIPIIKTFQDVEEELKHSKYEDITKHLEVLTIINSLIRKLHRVSLRTNECIKIHEIIDQIYRKD
ncbi:uncharacterized protein VNE69_06002 [Vairimorpha necatrix]|uniref:Uncharacterized protein n=1 Tax=Vairimorpha necatrix TaxID=6039 RepID=A0AAX4JCF7_9MICR